MIPISLSIVLYNTDPDELHKLLNSIYLFNKEYQVFLVDNSPQNGLMNFEKSNPNITYIHNPSNPGFGASHNMAIEKAIAKGYKYHFIINPDIYFTDDVIPPMVNYMQQHPDVGMMMPEVLNPDGTAQSLPKLLPRPEWILRRKLKFPKNNYNRFISKYELSIVPRSLIYNSPILSGCFTLLNLKAIIEIGLYDESYFMYFEDFDLSRRMHVKYKTIYYPMVSVFHGYAGGANKNFKLFLIFVKSAITYFNKWGWIFDPQRKNINKKTLEQFK